MKYFNNLPIYEGRVEDEEAGMFCISLVDSPATESNFMFFGKDKELQTYAIQNEEQHIIFGLVMAADLPIYRVGPSGYEYYIVYHADTLRLMAEKYLKNGFSSNVDLNHDGTPVEGVDMVQLFVKDTEKGINPKGFEEYADGSLFAEFKVHNEEIWSAVKDGTFKGFSMAGLFEVKEVFENQKDKKDKIMTKIERVKTMLRKMLAEFGEISTDKGVVIWDGDEDLKEGDAVHGIDEEGNEVALEDGVYYTEDKKAITIADGKVVSIEDQEAEVAPAAEPENTDEADNEPAVEEEVAEEAEPAAQEEEQPAEEPAQEDERDARIAELEARIAELEAENNTLKDRIAELEKESAAPSAEEAFEKQEDDNSIVAQYRKKGYKI